MSEIPPTLTESNGPDRFNMHAGCSKHHSGVRTGITDYCCCCDPCNYFRFDEQETFPENRLCCRCFPKIIALKYTQTNSDSCCVSKVTPLYAQQWTDDLDQSAVRYVGSIVGHTAYIYISNNSVTDGNGYGNSLYDATCRWTIRIPSLGIDEEYEIDHNTVTCLGVPAITISNVPANNGCVGSISLVNHEVAKVPFQHRDFPESFPDGYGLSIPFAECSECTEVPRFICVREYYLDETQSADNPPFWREFEWDSDFVPYYSYTLNEDVVGRWYYTPLDASQAVQSLYIIKDSSGNCWIQTDFKAPTGPEDTASEEFPRFSLSSCGCTLKILRVQSNNLDSTGASEIYKYIDLRGGRCGCWSYICGKRRCVPRYLCGFLFVDGDFYKDISWTWSNDTKTWESSGGVDTDGNAMPFSISLSLTTNDQGECEVTTSYLDYDLTGVSIGDDDTVISGTIAGADYSGTSHFALFFETSFDGVCNSLFNCLLATPCADECGSHPQVLFVTYHGWNDPYLPFPSVGECTSKFTLAYYQRVLGVNGNPPGPSIDCGYVSYKVVLHTNELISNPPEVRGDVYYLHKLELKSGVLTLTEYPMDDLNNPKNVYTTTLDPEDCDPYYAYEGVFTYTLPNPCFFGDTNQQINSWDVEVTE